MFLFLLYQPRDLVGGQRNPVASCMTYCEKCARAGKSQIRQKSPNIDNTYKIGTWNVQGMNEDGKVEHIMNEMQNMKLDIMGLSETFLKETGDYIETLPSQDKFRIIYSGGKKSREGVGFILNKRCMNMPCAVIPVSERLIAMRIEAQPRNIFLIQCYSPTAEKHEERETFYNQLKKVIKKKKSEEILMVLGDFNAKVGLGRIDNIVGPFGLGVMNDAGEDFVSLCSENDLTICNTWFEQKESARHTWTSPSGNTKNQIDYICINQRYRNAILNAKARPGADCNSDHNPVIVTLRVKLKKLVKSKKKHL